MRKMIQQLIFKKNVDKTTRKKSKYLSNETILKVDHLGNPMQRLKPLQNNQFESTFKIHKKNAKNDSTTN